MVQYSYSRVVTSFKLQLRPRNEIQENVKEANKDLKVPIYGIALGEDADFDLITNISDTSGGFARRIYESGRSIEQLENLSVPGNPMTKL